MKETLNKALNYYEQLNRICIVNSKGVVEFAAVYDEGINNMVNQDITGMHILDAYPKLTKESSTVYSCLHTGEAIYDSLQKLTYFTGEVFYFLNTDFPVVSNGKVVAVIEATRQLTEEEYRNYFQNNGAILENLTHISDIKSQDKDFLTMIQTIPQIANTDSSVLIVGETGTGKDLVAQAIHIHSFRQNRPFIAQNCAAIPSTLLESTFFGTIKGAFTGSENSKGLFELADGGTLFLDEINSMDIYLQAKILKVVEDQRIRPVGSSKSKKVNVRILSAMNVDPYKEIENGRLREDLFYRLGVVKLDLPPLRDREGDIKYLTEYFINYYNKKLRKNVSEISPLVEDIFQKHPWTGNVRELKNVVEYIFNFINGETIQLSDIPNYLYQQNPMKHSSITKHVCSVGLAQTGLSLGERVDLYEKQLIIKSLQNTESLKEAAQLLKISPQSLQYKLNKYKLKKI